MRAQIFRKRKSLEHKWLQALIWERQSVWMGKVVSSTPQKVGSAAEASRRRLQPSSRSKGYNLLRRGAGGGTLPAAWKTVPRTVFPALRCGGLFGPTPRRRPKQKPPGGIRRRAFLLNDQNTMNVDPVWTYRFRGSPPKPRGPQRSQRQKTCCLLYTSSGLWPA